MGNVRVWSNGLAILLPADGVESDLVPEGGDFGLGAAAFRGSGVFMRNVDGRTEALAKRLCHVWRQFTGIDGPVVVSLPPAKDRVLTYLRKTLSRQGITAEFILPGDDVEVAVPPTLINRPDPGPFDIVGDIHGCEREFRALLKTMGYVVGKDDVISHPEGRMLVSAGDVVDKGPSQVGVLRMMLASCRAGTALWVKGNHEWRLQRLLRRYLERGIVARDDTLLAVLGAGQKFAREIHDTLCELAPHIVLSDGRLVVTHAAYHPRLEGSMSGPAQTYCMFGPTTGDFEDGLPQRVDWTGSYDGDATVVFGHVPGKSVRFRGKTVCVDTGCYKTGRLSALSWPEMVVHET